MNNNLNTIGQRSSGLSMIEVLISLVVFLIAAAALITGASNLFATNRVAGDTYSSTMISCDFLSISEANPDKASTLNGMTFKSGSAGAPPFNDWWAKATSGNPLLQSATVATTPSTCHGNQACQVSISLTWRQPGLSRPVTRTFVMQDGY